MNFSDIEQMVSELWEWNPWVAVASGGLLGLLVLALVVGAVVGLTRVVKGADSNLKLTVGTLVVQAGVTWAVTTGTYDFGLKVFKLPEHEAVALAVFLEAATWVTVGMILDHGRGKDKNGKSNTGFGPAGPFFFLFSILGGVLAVIAGQHFGAAVGRAVVVVFGTCLWYLTMLRKTHRSGTRTRWRWTPRRLGVALGLMEPEPEETGNENVKWQIQRLARAIRWSNGFWPWSKLGARSLVKIAETTTEDVIDAARRRYAVAHLLVKNVKPDSEVMTRVIESVKEAANAPVAHPGGAPTAHPLRTTVAHPDAAQVAHPTDAPAHSARALPPVAAQEEVSQVARPAARVDAGVARRGQVVMRRPAEPTEDEREAAFARAVARVVAQGEKVRSAAREENVPESTLRTRVKQAETNGHQFETPHTDRAAV